MSNIGWDRLRQNAVVNNKPVEKMEHFDSVKVEKDASEGQKEFARRYNAMRNKLIEHGLMEKK